jgi:hypothetical protein
MKTTTEPVIQLRDIPRYFGGGSNGRGMTADFHFDHALDALIALTGRWREDTAVKLITGQLKDALGELLDAACDFGGCIPDGVDGGIDNWEDDVLFEVTGYRRKTSDENHPIG